MYKKSSILIAVTFMLCTFSACFNKTQKSKTASSLNLSFYNVENLFDTEDDPKTKDEQFLPNSEKKWTKERYDKKLKRIYAVLDSLEADKATGKVPPLMAFCELENKKVLEDLVAKTDIPNNYGIVHYDSPDVRGIDVGFVYNPAVFEPISSEALPINFDFLENVTTRDILYVQGKIKTDTLHIFVNHWSSRRGGEEESAPKRFECAKVLKTKTDAIFAKNKNAKIVIVGDFNDEPINKSITDVLGAKPNTAKTTFADKDLINLTYGIKQNGEGTYNFRGKWNMLDQIIVSEGLLQAKKGLKTSINNVIIYRQDFMLFTHKKYGKSPNRTYGGDRYYGGYSDHLPIYLKMEM